MSTVLKVKTAAEIEAFKQASLDYHKYPSPGKLTIHVKKSMDNQRELGFAYSPGVAFPCIEINKNPDLAQYFTWNKNLVAVISNSTAVLGLGDLKTIAGLPVMEGKSALFKLFAGLDSVPIMVDIKNDIEAFISAVKGIAVSFGGINLEDISSPDCFEIEARLRAELDIPVFHDDQHGTAIITLAGLKNACEVFGKQMSEVKVVMSGAGAAGIACLELIIKGGVDPKNVIICDRKGVVYKGRAEDMTPTKEKYATTSSVRTIAEALVGADVFIGLSVKGAVSKEMVAKMAENPIIFAMANPDPEITPEEVHEIRPDAIVATGRSDYPNQVNNVMGFPYIFRGALDVGAKTINDEMKIAASEAISALAKQSVPYAVKKAYPGHDLEYGRDYIIPTPFDPRLIVEVSCAVAKAAMETGVAKTPIQDWDAYRKTLISYTDPSINIITGLFNELKNNPKRIIFAEGEELEVIRAALQFLEEGLGTPILVGRTDKICETAKKANIASLDGVEIVNAAISTHNDEYINFLFNKLQRDGLLHRDCERLVKTDRNIFAACMLACGHGDGLVTGATRGYQHSIDDISLVIDTKEDHILFGTTAVLTQDHKIIFVSDTSINEDLSADELAHIAIETANKARLFGITPRVAFISNSNFGSRNSDNADKMRAAVSILDDIGVDFEYDGEMTATIALADNPRQYYPFNRLSGSANILIMSNAETATVALSMLKNLEGTNLIGSILSGFNKSVQVVRLGSDSANILNLAVIAGIFS
jgi:malate dehydrogenase (oxaloacetate-decarboxylating)(NADP+)